MAKRRDSTRTAMENADRTLAGRQAQESILAQLGPQRTAAAMRAIALIKEQQRQGVLPSDTKAAVQAFVARTEVERGLAGLASYARRIGEVGVREIAGLGLSDRILQRMKADGLDSHSLKAAAHLLERGGLASLERAVGSRLQVEAQAAMQNEAAGQIASFFSQATEDDRGRLHALVQHGGPELAAEALQVEAGMSPDAAALLAGRIGQVGVDGAISEGVAFTEQVIHAQEAQARRSARVEESLQASRATMERLAPKPDDSPAAAKLKDGSPLVAMLRDPGFHESSAVWFAANAERLAERGMKLRKGESPAEFLIRATLAAGEGGEKAANDHPERLFQPRWTSEEAVAALSDVFGETPQVVTHWLAMVHEADAHHQIRARLAKSDELAASKRGPPAPLTRAARDAESRRAAIEAAARKVEGAEEDRPVAHSATEALMDYAEGREPAMSSSAKRDVERIRARRHHEAERHQRSVSGRVEQAAAYLDRRQPAAPESPPTSDASPSGGMSIRDAMEAAESRLTSNGGNADE